MALTYGLLGIARTEDEEVSLKPLRLYLDTSVLGGAFDDEFEEDTATLLAAIRGGTVLPVLSEQLDIELLEAPPSVRRLLDELIELGAEDVRLSSETQALAAAYLAAGVVTQKISCRRTPHRASNSFQS